VRNTASPREDSEAVSPLKESNQLRVGFLRDGKMKFFCVNTLMKKLFPREPEAPVPLTVALSRARPKDVHLVVRAAKLFGLSDFDKPTSEDADEIWKGFPGHEDRYEVSDRGRVRSLPKIRKLGRGGEKLFPGQIMKLSALGGKDKKGNQLRGKYLHVNFNVDGKPTWKSVSRAVAQAFLGPCPDGQDVKFKDNDASNVAPSNLYYAPHNYRAPRTTYRKFSDLQISKAESLLLDDTNYHTYADIAAATGTSIGLVHKLATKNGVSRQHGRPRINGVPIPFFSGRDA